LDLNGLNVLVTGGTGSFGRKFTEVVLRRFKPRRLIIFSRDELKQYEMQMVFNDSCMRYFIGDVRDRDRLQRALSGVDVVVHGAALKQVPTAEYNPFEAIKTNVLGAQNIIEASIDCGVKKVLAISTDKAVNPINLYGATKLCSDKLFIAGNSYAPQSGTRFSIVRYGNVIGSRGSVIPHFLNLRDTGRLPVTDERMTRFWITLTQSAEFVLQSLELMQGGEIFVKKLPSMRIIDIAKAIGPNCQYDFIGVRPGEKLDDIMIPGDEARSTYEFEDHFRILPPFKPWSGEEYRLDGGQRVNEGFEYSSETNDWEMSADELLEKIEEN
jgi:UDP-N-acetylglucosamine 4,6-dehydratase